VSESAISGLSGIGSSHHFQISAKTAKWGVSWFRKPLAMPIFALAGLGIAIGHHFYFQYLDRRQAPDDGVYSQQVVKQIGNAFVFLALACFRASIVIAYNQYIWTIFRRKSLKISTIDNLFSLPSRLLSFMSWQVLSKAPLAVVLGAVPWYVKRMLPADNLSLTHSWLLFLGGLTPAATLSVIQALHTETTPGQVPVPNFRMPAWSQYQSMQTDETMEPTAQMLKVVSEAALNMKVLPPTPPSLNSSFGIQFYGPTVQCNDSTPQQEAQFLYFMKNMAREAEIFTAQQVESGNYTSTPDEGGPGDATTIFGALVLSAFSPSVHSVNDAYQGFQTDDFNNWYPEMNYSDLQDYNWGQSGVQTIWIQLSNQTLVCTAVNASFEIGFEYSNGVGSVTHQNIQIIPAGDSNADIAGTNAVDLSYDTVVTNDTDNTAYFTSFLALGSNIFGNISLENTNEGCKGGPVAGCIKENSPFDLQVETSRAAVTGLIACNEIAHNYWYDIYNIPSNESNFPAELWMCRNRTLARGIEDLANNLTISMLSSANFTTNTTTQITSSTTQNVYRYDKRNLFISYGAVIVVTLFVLLVGLLSLISNGVYHDGSFSTIMATTRNPDLDALSQGACLGGRKDIAENNLMFGVLTQNESSEIKGTVSYDSGYRAAARHVAFGLEGYVVRLRKGDPCS
jgi:hypothetical protein